VLIAFLLLYRLLKNYASITRSGSQPDLVLPSPNVKDDCTYGVQLLGTLKYDRIDIQSKVFNGANSIPLLYRLLKNYASITRSGSQPYLVIPSLNAVTDCYQCSKYTEVASDHEIPSAIGVLNGCSCVFTHCK